MKPLLKQRFGEDTMTSDERKQRSWHESEVLNAARKQKLLAIIEEKQDGDLKDMGITDLQKLVDAL